MKEHKPLSHHVRSIFLLVLTWCKNGDFPNFGDGKIFSSGFWCQRGTSHTPWPARKIEKNVFFKKLKMYPHHMRTSRKIVLTWWGRGLCSFFFLKKGFKILDLGSPINIISHYGARTFEYNLDLNNIVSITSF